MTQLTDQQKQELISSGEYSSNEDNKTKTEYIKSFSMGALILGWIWILFSRLYSKLWVIIPLFIPGINIVFAIWLGVEGRRMAWEEKKWDDFEEFKQRQGKLDKTAGTLLFFGIFAIIIILSYQ